MVRRNRISKRVGYITDNGIFVKKSISNDLRVEESTQLYEDAFKNRYGTWNVIVPDFNPKVLAELLGENVYHNKAVSAIADDGSGIGWELLKDSEDNNKKDFVGAVLEGTDIKKVFNNAFKDLKSVGYFTIEVMRRGRTVDGPIDGLEHVPSFNVRVHRSRDKFVQMVGGKHVWFKRLGFEKDVHIATGKEYEKGTLPLNERANEIYFGSNYSPNSVTYGMSDAVPALGALSGDMNRRDHVGKFFKTGGMINWAVTVTGDINQLVDEEGNEIDLQEEILSAFDNLSDNPYGAMVLVVPTPSGGDIEVKFEKLSEEQKEVSFREYRIDNRDEILSAHGVPPQRLGISETGNLGGSNTEEVMEVYFETIVKPLNTLVEDFINSVWIPSLYVEGITFRLIKRGKKDLDIQEIKELHGMGAMTTEEVRDLFTDKYNLTDINIVNAAKELNEEVEKVVKEKFKFKNLFNPLK